MTRSATEWSRSSRSSPDGKRRTGTGFIVRLESDAAYIVTAHHVVEGDKQPSVFFYCAAQCPVPAEFVKGDARLDAALLIVGGRDNVPQGARALSGLESGQTLKRGTTSPPSASRQAWATGRSPESTIASQEGSRPYAVRWHRRGQLWRAGCCANGRVVAMVSAVQGIAGRATPALILRYALNGWGIEAQADADVAAGATTSPAVPTPSTTSAVPPATGSTLPTPNAHVSALDERIYIRQEPAKAEAPEPGSDRRWVDLTFSVGARPRRRVASADEVLRRIEKVVYKFDKQWFTPASVTEDDRENRLSHF